MKNIVNLDLCDGVSFSYINSKKFKTAQISITFFSPLDKCLVSKFALLIGVLSISCKKFKNYRELSRHTEELYGACLDYDISKIGNYQALQLIISGIDDRFTMNNEKNIDKMSDLLCELIFNPLVENDSFDSSAISMMKLEISELIDSQFTDKRIWSALRCDQIMLKDEKSGISEYGEKSDLEKIDGKSLFESYKKLLSSSRIKIFAVADTNCDYIVDKFKSYFKNIERKDIFTFSSCPSVIPSEVKEVSERIKVEQCKLVMGFRTPFIEPISDTVSMQVATAILGQLPTSRLFKTVREKLNLCYYCFPIYNSSTGILYVQSGIEQSNARKTKDEILNQINIMQNSGVSDEELNDAKDYIVQRLNSRNDNISFILEWYIYQYPFLKFETPEQYGERVMKVNKEDILECINSVKLDTVYTLNKED